MVYIGEMGRTEECRMKEHSGAKMINLRIHYMRGILMKQITKLGTQ